MIISCKKLLSSSPRFLFLLIAIIFIGSLTPCIQAQDWVKTGTNLGVQKIRLAAADFKAASSDAQTTPLKSVFDTTLYNDLKNAGVFDMVSKSMAPPQMPGSSAGDQSFRLGCSAGER